MMKVNFLQQAARPRFVQSGVRGVKLSSTAEWLGSLFQESSETIRDPPVLFAMRDELIVQSLWESRPVRRTSPHRGAVSRCYPVRMRGESDPLC